MENYKQILKQHILNKIPESKWELTGVYEIINTKRNRKYIGSTSRSFKERFYHHLKDLIKIKHCNYKLQQDFLNDKIENFIFIIIEIALPEKVVNIEQKYIDLILPYYNICAEAGSALGRKITQAQKNHLSKIHTSKFNEKELIEYYIKNGSHKTIKKFHTSLPTVNKILRKYNVSKHKTGITLTNIKNYKKYYPDKILEMYDSKMSIRTIKKESHLSFEKIKGILIKNNREIIQYYPCSESRKNQLKIARKGKILSKEHRKNLSRKRKGKFKGGSNPNARKVINRKTGVIYSSIMDVSILYNMNYEYLAERLHERKGKENKTNFIFLNCLKNPHLIS